MRKVSLITFASLLLCLFTSFPSHAQIPRLINYQGKLTDTSGNPVSDGTHSLTFRIYDAESGGTLLWEETQNLLISKGIFSCLMGGVTELNLPFDKPYWLAIKVGSDAEMAPRQQIASVGYAIRAENADKLKGRELGDFILVSQTAGGDLTGTYPDPVVADSSISQLKLKTATGEVTLSTSHATGVSLVTGGTYAFMPQFKKSGTDDAEWIHAGLGSSGDSLLARDNLTSSYTGPYITANSGHGTLYAQTRYITASGQDYWIFLLVDKNTKDVIIAWAAPDHPSYGNGGNPEKVPHPFSDYDESKHEIILLDKVTCNKLVQESKQTGESILTLINEEYEPVMTKKEIYQPLHSGKFLEQEPVLIKTIPDYITVRKLVKLTPQEKQQREIETEQ